MSSISNTLSVRTEGVSFFLTLKNSIQQTLLRDHSVGRVMLSAGEVCGKGPVAQGKRTTQKGEGTGTEFINPRLRVRHELTTNPSWSTPRKAPVGLPFWEAPAWQISLDLEAAMPLAAYGYTKPLSVCSQNACHTSPHQQSRWPPPAPSLGYCVPPQAFLERFSHTRSIF